MYWWSSEYLHFVKETTNELFSHVDNIVNCSDPHTCKVMYVLRIDNQVDVSIMYDNLITDKGTVWLKLHDQPRNMFAVYQLSLVMRKPVFGVSDQVRLKPACSATETETSYSLEIAAKASRGIIYYLGSEQQRRWSDCANAQADLRLCCSHMTKTGFLMMWLNWPTILSLTPNIFFCHSQIHS